MKIYYINNKGATLKTWTFKNQTQIKYLKTQTGIREKNN